MFLLVTEQQPLSGHSHALLMYVEVQRGDGVADTLQAVPGGRVLGVDHHQGPGLGACHQPITRLIGELDGHETQDGAAVNLLSERKRKMR